MVAVIGQLLAANEERASSEGDVAYMAGVRVRHCRVPLTQ